MDQMTQAINDSFGDAPSTEERVVAAENGHVNGIGKIPPPPAPEDDYVSTSSVDRPPRDNDDEPREYKVDKNGQTSFVDTSEETGDKPEDLEGGHERKWGVELILKLKDTSTGKSIPLPLLVGEYYGRRVHELCLLALRGGRNLRLIEGVLDNPDNDVEEKKYPFTLDGNQFEAIRAAITTKQMLAMINADPSTHQLYRQYKDGKVETLTIGDPISLEYVSVDFYFTRPVVQEKEKDAA